MKKQGITKLPKWTEEEMILALDVYFKLEPHQLNKRNRRVLDLSILLNHLDIHQNVSEMENFRNPTGVSMILQNIASIDPMASNRGLPNASKLIKRMFEQYTMQRDRLHQLAYDIKDSISDPMIRYGLYRYGDEEGGELCNFAHQEFERLSNVNEFKKELIGNEEAALCEVCKLDLYNVYGERAHAAISCHYDETLLRLDQVESTNTSDWALVCQNCHTIMHQHPIWLTTKEMSRLIIN